MALAKSERVESDVKMNNKLAEVQSTKALARAYLYKQV